MKKIKFNKEGPERIDKFLSSYLDISRNKVLGLIKDLKIQINNEWVDKPGQLIYLDDEIKIFISKEINEIKSININLNILFESENYIIVYKPSGLLTHSSSYNEEDTLAGRVKYYFENKNIFFSQDDKRWGICHRLDKDTSGLIIVGKNIKTQEIMMNLIKDKLIKREYSALIWGHLLSKKIKVDVPIIRDKKNGTKMLTSNSQNAKDAITYFEVIKEYEKISLIKCFLETGRTHQIRVHLLYLNNPIINDPIYSKIKKTTKYGQYLIANKLEFIDPFSNIKQKIEIPLDNEFNKYIEVNK